MSRSEVIVIRATPELKRKLEEAAGLSGQALSTLVLRAAEAAADGVLRRDVARRERSGRDADGRDAAIVHRFRTAIDEASRGGALGYERAGGYLLSAIGGLVRGRDPAELRSKLGSLGEGLAARDDVAVLNWLVRELPAHMRRIPARRLPQLLTGLYRAHDERGLGVASWRLSKREAGRAASSVGKTPDQPTATGRGEAADRSVGEGGGGDG